MTVAFRGLAAAVVAAMAGAALFAAAYARDPGLAFEMHAPLPSFISGFYAGEHDGEVSLAWTSEHVTARFDDLDRGADWTCVVRLRGPRPPDLPTPFVDVLVDGRRIRRIAAEGDFHDVTFRLPPDAGRRAAIALVVGPTFTPGTADTRVLGVQVDRFACAPAGLAWPPRRAWGQMAAAGAFLAGLLALAGWSLSGAVGAGAALGAGLAATLASSGAAHGDLASVLLRLTVWTAVFVVAGVSSIERVRGQALTADARLAVAASTVVFLLMMTGLLHPSKPVIDARFHAHRLDWVLAGRYFFTQPVGGVEMPYAIGLYVFAAPFAWITADHMAVIRGVTAASWVFAGALLYPVVARAWQDRRAAALAVMAYLAAPLAFATLGNANLTNLFAQAMALVVVAAAVSWPLSLSRPMPLAAFTLLLAWALGSHVGAAPILGATLASLAALFVWRGDAARRRAAVGIGVALAAAAVVAWLVYYRHFADTLVAAFSRMFSSGAMDDAAATPPELVKGYMTPVQRVADLGRQAAGNFGWPALALALVGAWRIGRRGSRDRLSSALLAWAAVWVVFSASTVVARVDAEYIRYAAEFLGRINLATLPLVAILAGAGASAAWDDTLPSSFRAVWRWLAPALVAWMVLVGWQHWRGWL